MAYANQGQEAVQTQTKRQSESIINAFADRIGHVESLAKRLTQISDRLTGPRPRDVTKEPPAGGPSPGVIPFANRLDNVDAQLRRLLSECESSINAIESFV